MWLCLQGRRLPLLNHRHLLKEMDWQKLLTLLFRRH
jgi:hypothetical protein